MLRTQTRKHSSFHVCASCLRQHTYDLAQMRFDGRIRTVPFPSTSRPFSSNSTTYPTHLVPQKLRNGARVHGVLPRVTRVDERGYAAWGKFGSPSLPGQSNNAWGVPSSTAQSNVTSGPSGSAWGGASKIPPATGTSAWGGGGRPPPTPQASAWASGTSNSVSSTEVNAWGRGGGSGTTSPPVGNSTWGGSANKIPETTGTSAWGAPGRTTPTTNAPNRLEHKQPDSIRNDASTIPTERGPTSGSQHGGPQQSTVSAHRTPGMRDIESGQRQATIAASSLSGSNSGQPWTRSWGKGAQSVFPSSSETPSWASGNPRLGGSSSWTPKRDTPVPSKKLDNNAGFDSGRTLRTSNPDTMIWNQGKRPDSSSASPNPGARGARSVAPRSASGDRYSDPILGTVFTKPPMRKPPAPAEFPQLRRRSSRDDMFEAMSPFKLPSKQQWSQRKIPTPGSSGNAIVSELISQNSSQKWGGNGQSPRRDRSNGWDASVKSGSSNKMDRSPNTSMDRVASGSSQPSESEDQFELMHKSAVTKPKTTYAAEQDDWDNEPAIPRPSQQTRIVTERDATAADVPRRARNSGSDVETRGRGRERDRRGRVSDQDDYASRDKANKRKNAGGKRRQSVDEDEAFDNYDGYQEARASRKQQQRRLEEQRAAEQAAAPKAIRLPEYITVHDLAEALRIKPANFLRDLEQLGFENTLQDSVMTGETAALVAAEYGFEPTVESGIDVDLRPRPPPDDPSSAPPRPPIVTIMGHVDHGKTTILDNLRKSSIVAQEFGGITQHIGAFSVKLSMGKTITFLDTPGHAAFLSMRQRGANVTDIVVLVVAVDDSVMPQTIEAIKHAQSAKVPMIVAINKIDVDNTRNRIDMVKQDLAKHGVELEDYGGDVQVVTISGKTGLGMRDLEDAVLTLSEVLDMRAETDGMAEGWVLEASIKPDGRAATILVKRGTLRIGDLIVAGTAYTKVRIMRNEAGVDVEDAGPGTPVEIYGSWKGEPLAGDMVLQAPDESKAQGAVDYRQEIADRAIAAAQNAEKEAQDRERAEREALKKRMEEAEEAEAIDLGPKDVSLIIKGDVMGSVEAVSLAIQEIGNNEVRPRILRASPGQISESDVDHMAIAKGAIVNFNASIPAHILQRADKAGVVILDHNIIYETVQAVKDLLSAQLKPIYTQRVLAEAQVQQIFPINITKRKYKNVAGVKVTNGKVTRGGQYRVMRDGEEVHKGKLSSLKQNRDEITEVRKGAECGMMFDEFEHFQEGDLIQLYEDVEQPRYL